MPAHYPMLSVTLLNFGLRTSAVALFPRQATPGGASSLIRSCHPLAVLFSPKGAGYSSPAASNGGAQPWAWPGWDAALKARDKGTICLALFLSGIRKTRTLYAKRRFRFLTISPALCSLSWKD